MLIVLEGVDCAGKSSLADDLEKIGRDAGLLVTREHKGPPASSDAFTEYETPLVDYRPNLEQLIICDRWHMGEWVYGPKYRGSSLLDTAGLRHVDLFLRARGALQVVLEAPHDVLLQRLRQRGDLMVAREDMKELTQRYDQLVHRIGPHVLRVIADQWSAAWLFRLARVTALAARRLQETETYVGPADNVKLLLLGEKRGVGVRRRWNESLPAFVPRTGTSGSFLITALEESGVAPQYGLVNALEDDWTRLWQVLDQPAVVTLGVVADRAAKLAGVPHGSVPHPAYVKRFHHGRSTEYAEAIMHAAETEERVWLT